MNAQDRPGYIGTASAKRQGGLWYVGQICKTTAELARWFDRWGLDVPAETRRMWFHLYSTPGEDSAELRVASRPFGSAHYPVVRDGTRWIFDRYQCDKRLKPFIGKPVYVEVEYLEP